MRRIIPTFRRSHLPRKSRPETATHSRQMSAAQVRHGLRRLLRVARRLDGDRAMLRALLPVAGAHLPSLPGDDAEEELDDTVRGVVTRAVREAGGVAARPEGVREMSRNAAALEAVEVCGRLPLALDMAGGIIRALGHD